MQCTMRRTGNKLKLKIDTNTSISDKNVKLVTLSKFHAYKSDVETKIQFQSNQISFRENNCNVSDRHILGGINRMLGITE